MQLTIDSKEPIDRVLRVVGSFYGVELRVNSSQKENSARPSKRTSKATPAASKATTRPSGARARATRKANADPAVVRAWARTHGHAIKDRGRVPAEVVAAYQASL
jgi:hypothetical protein